MRNYEQYKRMIRFLTSIAILIVEIGIYWFAWNRYFSQVAGTPFFRKGDWLMAMVYGLLLLFFFKNVWRTENRVFGTRERFLLSNSFPHTN